MKRYILPILAVLFGLSACSTDSDIADVANTDNRVIINASIGNGICITRSNPLGTAEEQEKFNAGDVIRISNGTESVDYKLDADGETWKPADGGKELTWGTGESTTFTAYYPVKRGYSYDNCHLPDYQADVEAKDLDYMTATVTKPNSKDKTLQLNFERKTALAIFNVDYAYEYDGANPEITNFYLYGRTYNYQSSQIMITSRAIEKNKKYVAFVFPIESAPKEQFLRIAVKKDNETKRLWVTGVPKMEAGKSYTFNVKVGKDYVYIESVDVMDWTEGFTVNADVFSKIDFDVTLGEDVSSADDLTNLLNRYSGTKSGEIKLKGTWNDDYYTPLSNFLKDENKEITLDLSQVKGMKEVKSMGFAYCRGLSGITLPETVTSFGNYAFLYTKIKSIDLTNVKTIEENAFSRTLIENITISASITEIKSSVLAIMEKLKTIKFEGDIKKIWGRAFSLDYSLETIDLSNCTTVPTISTGEYGTFNETTPANITVIVGSEAMKTAFENDAKWKSVGFKEFKVKEKTE